MEVIVKLNNRSRIMVEKVIKSIHEIPQYKNISIPDILNNSSNTYMIMDHYADIKALISLKKCDDLCSKRRKQVDGYEIMVYFDDRSADYDLSIELLDCALKGLDNYGIVYIPIKLLDERDLRIFGKFGFINFYNKKYKDKYALYRKPIN